jgi:hypothetical protein
VGLEARLRKLERSGGAACTCGPIRIFLPEPGKPKPELPPAAPCPVHPVPPLRVLILPYPPCALGYMEELRARAATEPAGG